MKILKILSVVLACVKLTSCTAADTDNEEETMKQQEKIILHYPLFDGKKVIENASIVIEDGIITAIKESESTDTNYFLMPGLIDAHTHMNTEKQTEEMLANGVTTTCDVAASASLIENSRQFTIISSAGMTMGTLNGKSYVKKAIEADAERCF